MKETRGFRPTYLRLGIFCLKMVVANDSADWLGAYEDKETCGRDTLMDVGLSTVRRSLFWLFMLNRDYRTEKKQPTRQNDLTSWQLWNNEFWNNGCIKTAAKVEGVETMHGPNLRSNLPVLFWDWCCRKFNPLVTETNVKLPVWYQHT